MYVHLEELLKLENATALSERRLGSVLLKFIEPVYVLALSGLCLHRIRINIALGGYLDTCRNFYNFYSLKYIYIYVHIYMCIYVRI